MRDYIGGEGKGKGRDTGDGIGDGLGRLAGMLKKSEALRKVVNLDEVILWCVCKHEVFKKLTSSTLPFLGDDSTYSRRAAAYRILRQILDRTAWGKMINAGIEWLIVR